MLVAITKPSNKDKTVFVEYIILILPMLFTPQQFKQNLIEFRILSRGSTHHHSTTRGASPMHVKLYYTILEMGGECHEPS